jgi:hypothetical protein
MADGSKDRPSNKVARLIEEHELHGLGDEMESRWTAEGDERMSLRALARFFNARVLEEVLLDAGMSTIDTDLDQVYTNLTSDEVSAGVKTETRNRLERNGVDVEKLERDFVSYQAIRSYLKEWREASYERPSDEEKIDKDLESIQRLMTRTESVAVDRIEKLRNTGRISAGEFEILLSMQVLCQRCGTQYTIATFLEQGGCECMRDEDSEPGRNR